MIKTNKNLLAQNLVCIENVKEVLFLTIHLFLALLVDERKSDNIFYDNN